MFARMARLATRHPRLVILSWVVLVGFVLPLLPRIDEPLEVGGFSTSHSPGAETVRILRSELDLYPSQLAIIFTSETLEASDRLFLDQMEAALARVATIPFVEGLVTPEIDPSLVAPSGNLAYALVGLSVPVEEAQDETRAVREALVDQPDLDVLIAGGPAFYADIEVASQRDLQRAELIAFPFAMIALIVVFGSLVAAIIPLLVGSMGVAVALLALYWVAHITDMSIFVLNLTTMLGLGLAVDYSLFVTSRYREELARRDGDVAAAVIGAMSTAGRAVFFSGLSVLVGLSGLTLFDLMFLRSVGIAGVIVVAISTLASLTLLPAVLSVIGTRIDRLPIGPLARRDRAGEGSRGFWFRLATWVQGRPVGVMLAVLAILVLLGAPFLRANISSPDATMLPKDLPSRQGYDLLAAEFTGGEITPFFVVLTTEGDMRSEQSLRALDLLGTTLEGDPRIERIQWALWYPGASQNASPRQVLELRERAEAVGIDTRLDAFISDSTALVLAYPVAPANDPANKDLLRELRSLEIADGYDVLVAGGTAEIVDVVDEIYSDFPVVALLIVATTFVILTMLFRSIALPIKAILINTLSILAAYGALVWIFQDGNLHRFLGFTPQGYVEASLPVIMFCILFGLSMDYEVFLLSRIQEEWLRTGDNDLAVAVGLERSGRIISSAALIVVVVTASFVSADVVLVKALGLCIALAVALDATIVRALLVPATMKLLGHWNWWMPGWLDRWLPSIDLGDH